jgi:hypothetical protein
MNIANGAQVRINVRLNMRTKPAVDSATICTVQDGVLVTAMGVPANGWMKARVRGWEHEDHPGLVFSEAHASASISARNGGGLGWRQVEYVGYLSMANPSWWTVEDGPK